MRRKSLGKYVVGLGLVAMIFVALLGTMHIPLAIGERVTTTDCAVEFSNAASNDAPSATGDAAKDPKECGSWDYETYTSSGPIRR